MSNIGGSTYLMLGVGTSSISSKANASEVYTKTQLDNAPTTNDNQTTTYTKTEVNNIVNTNASKSYMEATLRSNARALFAILMSKLNTISFKPAAS